MKTSNNVQNLNIEKSVPKTLNNLINDTVGEYLHIENVENININKPYEIWVEQSGGIRTRYEDPDLKKNKLERLAHELATMNNIEFEDESRPLSTKLPDGSRIEIFKSACVEGGFSLSIRKRKSGIFTLRDFGVSPEDELLLKQYVIERKTILISGGTSSGKTTVLDALQKYIPHDRRLIVIQDPVEIDFDAPNKLELTITEMTQEKKEAQLAAISLTALRQNPDSIIFGEIRDKYMSMTLAMSLNTGHPGSMFTMHANSSEKAIQKLAALVHQYEGGDKQYIQSELEEQIDVYLHITKTNKGRTATIKLRGQ